MPKCVLCLYLPLKVDKAYQKFVEKTKSYVRLTMFSNTVMSPIDGQGMNMNQVRVYLMFFTLWLFCRDFFKRHQTSCHFAEQSFMNIPSCLGFVTAIYAEQENFAKCNREQAPILCE